MARQSSKDRAAMQCSTHHCSITGTQLQYHCETTFNQVSEAQLRNFMSYFYRQLTAPELAYFNTARQHRTCDRNVLEHMLAHK
jgi:hypothetical protein